MLAGWIGLAPAAWAGDAPGGLWGLGAPAAGVSLVPGGSPVGEGAIPDAAGLPARATAQVWASPVFTGAMAPLAPPAGAFTGFAGGSDRQRAIDCMTVAIAYEAGNQPLAGQQAVGEVILNRVRDPRFPKSVCGVVFAGSARATGCQFTFTCDGSMARRLADATVLTARIAAEAVLDGTAPDRVGGATHYHADYVLPYWALSGTAVARIGAHIFYRMPGYGVPGGTAPRLSAAAYEPPVATAEPAYPALARVATYAPPARGRHRAGGGRGGAARLAMMAAGAGTAGGGHALFAPWGLPVAGAQ